MFIPSLLNSGTSYVMSTLEKRNVKLSNYLSLIVSGCLVIVIGYRAIIDLVPRWGVVVIALEILLSVTPIVFNRFGYTQISRIWLCWFCCFLVLFNSYHQLVHIKNIETTFFVGIRFFLLAFACFPILIFNTSDRRNLFFGLFIPILSLLLYDPLLQFFNYPHSRDWLTASSFTYNTFSVAISYGVIALSIHFLKRIMEAKEHANSLLVKELDEKNKQLAAQAESELRISESKFKGVVENSLIGVGIIKDGFFNYVNPRCCEIFGYEEGALLKLPVNDLIIKDDQPVYFEEVINPHEKNKKQEHILRCRRRDSRIINVKILSSSFILDDSHSVIATMIDITEQLEEEKRLSKAVNDAQERERLEIGMELHDHINQILLASVMNLDSAEKLDQNNKIKPILLSKVKDHIREAVQELRRLSHQLAPSVGSTKTLEAKIKSIVENMNVTRKMSVSYQFSKSELAIREDIQLALYRILQEQFNNILKHAQATSTKVNIMFENEYLTMVVKDDGIGFNSASKGDGIGFENIRRRVQAFDGRMKIVSSPGNGCELIVKIPIQENSGSQSG